MKINFMVRSSKDDSPDTSGEPKLLDKIGYGEPGYKINLASSMKLTYIPFMPGDIVRSWEDTQEVYSALWCMSGETYEHQIAKTDCSGVHECAPDNIKKFNRKDFEVVGYVQDGLCARNRGDIRLGHKALSKALIEALKGE